MWIAICRVQFRESSPRGVNAFNLLRNSADLVNKLVAEVAVIVTAMPGPNRLASRSQVS